MVPELRQRHRRIWRMWAFLLPVGFVLAIVALPKSPTQPALVETTTSALPTLEQTQDNHWLTANLRRNDAGNRQLEIILKQPLNVPATQVFWQNGFIGSLGAKGVQRFALDSLQLANPPYTLEIRDPINKTIFQTITFQP